MQAWTNIYALLCFDVDLKHRYFKSYLETNNKALESNYLDSKGFLFTSDLTLGIVLYFFLPQCPQLKK